MNDAVLITGCYPSLGYADMVELTRQRNADYCAAHSFDFRAEIKTLPGYDVNVGAWEKIVYLQEALNAGYQYVVWLDADALIYDTSVDLRTGCPRGIGACWHRIPQLNHWNVGVLYLQNSPEVRNFLAQWLAYYPGIGDGWNEQGVFNMLGRKNKLIETLSDKWNATINVSMVPDAVVLGYHGAGNPQERFGLMKSTMDALGAR